MFTIQKLIFKLSKYWSSLGSNIVHPIDLEVGAATFHPITFFNSLNKNYVFYSYLQLCRRPIDGRYNFSFNKLQQYYQYQVIIKPTLINIQDLYLDSLVYLGIDLSLCDLRFIEDNWENPTLGAYGIGWEIWLNGMEITQFTYFQNVAGFLCNPVLCEITYGIERLSLYLQNVNHIYDLIWNDSKYGLLKYKNIFCDNEKEKYIYNFIYSDVNFLISCIENYEREVLRLISIKNPLIILSYEFSVKIVNYFNILDSKNYFSIIERKNFIFRIRNLFYKIAKIYISLL